ncbi:hypothetical protein JDN40_14440 [Rhodomicrobium vannielii ATCC 17100]|uniref:hypothetical protein n=1 Tax=Rhodomicrobium vannielii TaxID=1069 RepID=UPI00191B62A3|nr:hypothetical protein [Rhodomicrobium vannielii]MBJ7535307.1 hypothetical protein [Rhodomicrobium vannielii ATCC 17100]
MFIPEKLDACPNCGERGALWHYDGQTCLACAAEPLDGVISALTSIDIPSVDLLDALTVNIHRRNLERRLAAPHAQLEAA